MPAPIVSTVVGLLILALLWGVVAIRRATVRVPSVNVQAEQRRARERELRLEGNALLKQGRTTDAYDRFDQLSKLAPNSPAVNVMLQKLSAMRYHEEVGKQQIALAKQKLDAGIALYMQKKYTDAVPILEDAFNLNPTDAQAANYLRLAQLEEQRAITARLAAAAIAASQTRLPAVSPGGTGGDGGRLVSTVPSQLTTFFNSPFNDGVITVSIGGEVVVNETLWEEKGRFIRRKTPRVVNVARQLPARTADVFISVVVPTQKINAQQTFRYNFQPGAVHRLIVSFNPQNRTIDYQLN